jgi:hypothetical protein
LRAATSSASFEISTASIRAFGKLRLAGIARQPDPVQRSSTFSSAAGSSISKPSSPLKCAAKNSPIKERGMITRSLT